MTESVITKSKVLLGRAEGQLRDVDGNMVSGKCGRPEKR